MTPAQYRIRDILATMVVVGVLIAAWRVFGRHGVGHLELVMFLISLLSIVLVSAFPRVRWPWMLGLLVCFVVVWFSVSGRWPVRLTVAMCSSCLYIVSGAPVAMVNTVARSRRYYWILGAVACAAAPVLLTPADPISAFAAAIPLGCFYTLVAYVYKMWAKKFTRTSLATETV